MHGGFNVLHDLVGSRMNIYKQWKIPKVGFDIFVKTSIGHVLG